MLLIAHMTQNQHNKQFELSGKGYRLEDLWAWLGTSAKVVINKGVRSKLEATRAVVEKCLTDGEPHYGINTGFGSLANTRIPAEKLENLQYNLIRSHACGLGEPLSDEVVRLLMLFRANVLAMGRSGVRYELLEHLVNFINKGNVPRIPSQGSVGASGDLAPLAHLALALIEDGLKLEPKEGLSLINGIQASLAVAVVALRDAKRVIDNANNAAALTIEGLRGSDKPFDERIADVRPHSGHKKVSAEIRRLLKDSEIITSHKGCSRVQDPYSMRCVPQVHGAVVEAFEYVKGVIEEEISSCTDNPLIFGDDIISGGNFHGTAIALACDHLAAALTALGNISERRIEQMINPKQGELNVKYLVRDAGTNSGFMVAHVVASALASENKALAFPASSDSITTSGGQEDFVSMSMWAARKLAQVTANTEKIIAIELLSAAQAVDMQENKLKMGEGTSKIYRSIRESVLTLIDDRVLYKDIEKMIELIRSHN